MDGHAPWGSEASKRRSAEVSRGQVQLPAPLQWEFGESVVYGVQGRVRLDEFLLDRHVGIFM